MYCSCESITHGTIGPIDDKEQIARVVCSPRHIMKSDGSIKPGVFPPKHIAEKGLSLIRSSYLNAEELKMHAEIIASHNPKDNAVGTIEATAESIRSLVNEEGNRCVCLFADPIENIEDIPDNPAHALVIATPNLTAEDVAEVRTRLLLLFSPLRQFAA